MESPAHFVVAIDGVSGSGKSSTAKQVAKELGLLHLDTGAMYRMLTYAALREGLRSDQEAELATLAASLNFSLGDGGELLSNGKPLPGEIRGTEVSAAVSEYCKPQKVREALVAQQRSLGRARSCVAEGRDMGTVVFPDARFKFFMYANPEVRAQRRVAELQSLGLAADPKEVLKNLSERDGQDSGRLHSPLMKAPDAVEIDTSGLTFGQQVAIITRLVSKTPF